MFRNVLYDMNGKFTHIDYGMGIKLKNANNSTLGLI